jgi:hypothetical protein
MIEALYVPKSYGTYSDTCLMLGLACLAEYVLGATGQKQGMQLIDEGTCYRIQFNKPMDLSKIESIPYFDLFPIVVGAKTIALRKNIRTVFEGSIYTFSDCFKFR